jgi:tol-pal system protein YbgF
VSRRSLPALVVLLALAGCATRADLLRQEQQYRSLLHEQRRQLQAVQREVERLRAEVEEGGGVRRPMRPGGEDRLARLEQRLARLEQQAMPAGAPEAPPGAEPSGETPPIGAPPPTLPPAPPPAVAPEEDGWRREIAREQVEAGAVNVPERAEYLALLDGLARQDCARVVPQLNSFAAANRESVLADNALYWAARCYALRGDQNQAISKFYDVVTRYPKGDKAPAALWAQGNLFVDLGDSPDARLAFAKLIRDYPNSEEAARARQKLAELQN